MPSFLNPDQNNRFDSPNHAPEKMVWGQLRPHIILPQLLRDAFAKVSRPSFVPACYQESCYHDDNILLTEKDQKQRFLLAPLTLGKLLAHADLELFLSKTETRPGERSVAIQEDSWITASPSAPRDDERGKVLILCGGTGYSAALFGEMNIECVMIENCPELAERATENLIPYSKVSVKSTLLDLLKDIRGEDSFDIILIDGGAVEVIPPYLLTKLTSTGFLLTLQQQEPPCLDALSLCWGIKVSRTGAQTILFDAWAPVNQDFSAPPSFSF